MCYLSINKRQSATLLSVLAVLTLGLGQACLAQQSNVNGQPNATSPKTVKEMLAKPQVNIKGPKKPYVDQMANSKVLPADKANFDDLPPYTGKAKYQNGMIFQSPGSTSSIAIVTYAVAEPKDQVKEWYASSLRMYGWNITFQNDKSISATNNKSGNTCSLQFCNESATGKGHSLLQIDYHQSGH